MKIESALAKQRSWAQALENGGIVLTVLILVGGIYTCGQQAYVANSYGHEEFSFGVFIALYLKQIFYAVICYTAHHTAALIIGSLANISYNTKMISSANMITADGDNGKNEKKITVPEGPKFGLWYCPKCTRRNVNGTTCTCGYKIDENFSVTIDDKAEPHFCDSCKKFKNDVHTVSFADKEDSVDTYMCSDCIKNIYRS